MADGGKQSLFRMTWSSWTKSSRAWRHWKKPDSAVSAGRTFWSI